MELSLKPFVVSIVSVVLLASSAQGAIDVQSITYEHSKKTFGEIVGDLGFSKSEAWKLVSNKVVPKRMHLRGGERYLKVQDKDRGHMEGRFYLGLADEVLVFWKKDDNIGVDRKPVDYEIKTRTVEGLVQGSLIHSIKQIIPDDWAAFRFADAFSWDFRLAKKLKRNDRFKFTIEEKYDHGKFIRYGEITKARLVSNGQVLERVLWVNDKSRVFVDPNRKFEDRLFYLPVDYAHISSHFSRRRLHPLKRRWRPHHGVDFVLNEGDPIYAARDGVVEKIKRKRGTGRLVRLKHRKGFVTIYNHLSKWAHGLKVGDKVKVGQVIGYAGCTGYCTSPHLHFTIRKGNYVYDPVFLTKPYPYSQKHFWRTKQFMNLVAQN